MILQRKKIDPFLIIVTPILLFLLFWNLGNQFLWYDEAQTALLGRSVLEHGYPKALMGDFLIPTDEVYGPRQAYLAQPWLQNYVCALSFLLFGESNTSARVLFALFGLLSFYLLYALSYRLFENRFIARLTVLIAATCVPYLLMLRQARYYSLTVFLALVLFLSYLDFLKRKKFSSALFITTSFLLFHANYGCLIPVLAAIMLHFFLAERHRKLIPAFLTLYFWTSVLILPGIVFYKIWEHKADASRLIFHNAKFYLSNVNAYFLPYRFLITALAIIYAIRLAVKRNFRESTVYFRNFLKTEKGRAATFLFLVILVSWAALWFVDYSSLRYIIHLGGLFFIISAVITSRLFRRSVLLGTAFLLILCFSNMFNTSFFFVIAKPFVPLARGASVWACEKGIISEKSVGRIKKELDRVRNKARIRMYFFEYIYEITHDYDGPMEGVVKYLKRHARPGDIVKTHDFNANSLYYYTGLLSDDNFLKETSPEWVFLRSYWTDGSFYDTEYFKRIEAEYEKIELPYPDIWWENRPDDMSHHYFKTAPLDKKISLYKRR